MSLKNESDTLSPQAERSLVLSRTLNAPLKLVWDVWTQPGHIRNWWGPDGFYNSIFSMNVEPGGEWDFIMHGPDGKDYKNKSIFREVVPMQKLVYDHVVGPPFRFTVTFEPKGIDKTFLQIEMLFETLDHKARIVREFGADQGLRQNMERLSHYLDCGYVSDQLILTRLIAAPRDLVFSAWTNIEFLKKWWGPNGFTNPRCEMDLRPGGAIYIDMQAPDGTIYPMTGEVLEIRASDRFVFMSGAVDERGTLLFENINTLTLSDEDGKTRLHLQVDVRNIKDGASPYLCGMTEGWSQSLERLINLVE